VLESPAQTLRNGIRPNTSMNEIGARVAPVAEPDLSMNGRESVRLEALPQRWTNLIDLQTGIELRTQFYQLFLSQSDFWRATNSLQLDETIGIYVATLLSAREQLILVDNRHPMEPMSTLGAGFLLTLHGLSTEMLHRSGVRSGTQVSDSGAMSGKTSSTCPSSLMALASKPSASLIARVWTCPELRKP